MRNYIGVLVLGLLLSGCSAAGTPAETPDGTDSPAAESSETVTVNAPPFGSEEDSTTAETPQLMEPPKTCLVSREAPRSQFKAIDDAHIRYADDDLVITEVAGDLAWQQDGKTGVIYDNPFIPEGEEERSKMENLVSGWYFLSDGRFVVYDTCEELYNCPHFFVWDATTPEKPAVEFATAPEGKSFSQAHPSINSGRLLWTQPVADSDENQIMLRDLATGEQQMLAQGKYTGAAFAKYDLVLFTKPGETARKLTGTYISNSEEWHPPTALQDFRLSDYDGFVSDANTTAVTYGPLASGEDQGYGIAVWREGWSHALVDKSEDQVTLAELPEKVELQGDLLTYRLQAKPNSAYSDGYSVRVWNLRTGVIYEVYTEYGVPTFEGNDLVISTNVIKTPGGEAVRIPLSEFESGEC